nr:hypothetical protein CFP56_21723 [Quercus suber]
MADHHLIVGYPDRSLEVDDGEKVRKARGQIGEFPCIITVHTRGHPELRIRRTCVDKIFPFFSFSPCFLLVDVRQRTASPLPFFFPFGRMLHVHFVEGLPPPPFVRLQHPVVRSTWSTCY